MADFRNQLTECLNSFKPENIRKSSLTLLSEIGYESQRTIEIPNSSPVELRSFIAHTEGYFREDKALYEDWIAGDFLFQFTASEITANGDLFSDFEAKNWQSVLFFTIRLRGNNYARGKLAAITREINRAFMIPCVIIYSYSDKISIAIIHRRQHRLQASKDVLGKVALIHDIYCPEPHRGHKEILNDFALTNLPGKVTSFEELQKAWSTVLNLEVLNKKFYQRISDWFFYAVKNVHIPDKKRPGEPEERFRQTAVIRLITRIIFLWFAKEKEGLIPSELFEADQVSKYLNDFDSQSKTSGKYYQAILQNLFFPTLSVKQNEREFRAGEDYSVRRSSFMQHDKYRYRDCFLNPDLMQNIFIDIPFLNGGLFECLDQGKGDSEIRIDGFSDNASRQLWFANALFFGKDMKADLSREYDDERKSTVIIQGLFTILNDYKFTVEENTPIEEEIALDPELLGRIFENLLAQYNPETKKSARNETGSFYTPREIVNYMIDISLKAYLKDRMLENHPDIDEKELSEILDKLVAFEEEQPDISPELSVSLSDALYDLKVVDPACGSGAFPIGLLQKLVFILNRFDQNHDRWKQRVLDRTHPTMMKKTREMLDDPDSDYLWKANLIQSTIYGVDIQPIAVQIAKLRCFITLLVDFSVDHNEENRGVPPLPNLDFKFVAANTLLSAPEPKMQDDSLNLQDDFFRQLRLATERYFYLSELAEKNKVRDEVRKLIQEVIDTKRETLSRIRGSRSKQVQARHARQLEMWESYKNIFVSEDKEVEFFDTRYFFPEVEVAGGFDICIGNPPYVQLQKLDSDVKSDLKDEEYETYKATGDIYTLFYEKGIGLLNNNRYLSYISSNRWMRSDYGALFRSYLSKDVNTIQTFDFGMALTFSAATILTCVLLLKNSKENCTPVGCYAEKGRDALQSLESYFNQNMVKNPRIDDEPWVILSPERMKIKQYVEAQGVPLCDQQWGLTINRGVLTGLNEAFYIDTETRDAIIAKEPQAAEIIVPLLRGRFVDRYTTKWDGTWMINSHNGIKHLGIPPVDIESDYPVIFQHLKRYEKKLRKRQDQGDHWSNLRNCAYLKDFGKKKIIYPEITKWIPFFYDNRSKFFINNKAFILTSDNSSLGYLISVFNSSLFRCCFKDTFPELLGNSYEVRKVFLEQIPIKLPNNHSIEVLFECLVDYTQFTKHPDTDSSLWKYAPGKVAAFLEELIDGCVMELYFSEHMAERNLCIMDEVQKSLEPFADDMSDDSRRKLIESFYSKVNKPGHHVHDRIARFESDSPDILAVILREGAVDDRAGRRRLFNLIRSSMSAQKLYISYDEILQFIQQKDIDLEPSSLKVYLTDLTREQFIYDAGKGWYTILSEPLALDRKPVSRIVKHLKKTFPLMDFSCWSTEQLNRFSQHIFTRFKTFVYVDRDFLEAVGESLIETGFRDVFINPGVEEYDRIISRSENPILVLPSISRQPTSDTGYAPPEKVLADLVKENLRFEFMDKSEMLTLVQRALHSGRITYSTLKSYVDRREIDDWFPF